MSDADSLLQQRFGDLRPGLDLMAIEDAALPVTVVGTDVLAQERKGLPLLDEFVLRLTDAGLSSIDDIAAFLGLDFQLVESAVADQARIDNLSRGAGPRSFVLTQQGKRAVQELESIQPVQKQIQITFDRLTWAPTDYRQSELLPRRIAEDLGLLLLPATKTARISVEDLTVPVLNSLLASRDGKKPRFEVLNVRKVQPSTHRYLPVKLLVYGDVERDEVQLAVAVDGDVSQRHELALNGLGGAKQLGIKVAVPADRPVLTREIEDARVNREEIADIRATTFGAPVEAGHKGTISISELVPATAAEQELDKIPVRSVSMLEHRELLSQALNTARRRLLIMSPWIKSAVVDANFLGRLERLLRAKVRVHIAYGLGPDDQRSDTSAINRLRSLQARFRDQFTLTRLTSTHAKVLIFDDKWISTSFNWLSFRGDPTRTYRVEEGTLVRIPGVVDEEYARYVGLIDQHRADEPRV